MKVLRNSFINKAMVRLIFINIFYFFSFSLGCVQSSSTTIILKPYRTLDTLKMKDYLSIVERIVEEPNLIDIKEMAVEDVIVLTRLYNTSTYIKYQSNNAVKDFCNLFFKRFLLEITDKLEGTIGPKMSLYSYKYKLFLGPSVYPFKKGDYFVIKY